MTRRRAAAGSRLRTPVGRRLAAVVVGAALLPGLFAGCNRDELRERPGQIQDEGS